MRSPKKPNTNHFSHNNRIILWILSANFILRFIIAFYTDLGNDEVYYTNYALFPDWSYFDHPPMVGWLIRLSTFNMYFFNNPIFVRLGSLIIGSLNLWIVYKTAIYIGNKKLGIISTFLLSSSFYSSVIAGVFILPDTPLVLFWLLAINQMVKYINTNKNQFIITFGICVGFALLSKYQAIFLWFAAFIYFIVYNRKAFLSPILYVSGLLSAILFSPVIIWNFNSEFSGINYHTNRVGSDSIWANFENFGPELFGQIFYNNPVNFVLIIIGLVTLWKHRNIITKPIAFLLCVGLPLPLVTIFLSAYNKTLPHWSGPAYFALILVSIYAIQETVAIKRPRFFSNSVIIAQSIFLLVFIITLVQVESGKLFPNNEISETRFGKKDFTADISVWRELENTLSDYIETGGTIKTNIYTHNWFPAAHIDYYFAHRNNIDLYVVGNPNHLHQYIKINQTRGQIQSGSDAYFISTSHHYSELPEDLISRYTQVSLPQIIPIHRNNRKRVNLFLWKLSHLKENYLPEAYHSHNIQ
ncbi:glycosyltransferase family 39 protein [Saccharicrinis aurantiacus]|uniref:glycosyltransferase family 39 protein n=1 Tax=Saccharicrinis aurantiacus TaxID=1849719 RepID=UPI0008398452|nr:glycosyltransferase family 39 protein [Saccharicrinis aurantiacus]